MSTSRDNAELLELQVRYASTYDSGDAERFAEVFAENGRLVLPDGRVVAGREALTDFAAAAAARPFRTHHFMTNQTVEALGATAIGAAHLAAVSSLEGDVRLLVIGRYDDKMIRTSDGWRLSERVISALSRDDLTSR